MSKSTLFFIFILSIVSCDFNEKEEDIPAEAKEPGLNMDNNNDNSKFRKNNPLAEISSEDFTRTISKFFNINSGEKISVDSLLIDYDNDDILDVVYTINNLSKAKKDMSQKENPAKFLELGMMGNYNFIMLKNGKENVFYSPKIIPSSPYLPLNLNPFELSANSKSQISVEYRIRDAAYVNIYNIINNKLEILFQTKLYDKLSSSNPEAYVIEINQENSYQTFKNIDLYQAKVTKPKASDDLNRYLPKLQKTNTLLTSFFYNPKDKKYYFQLNSQR